MKIVLEAFNHCKITEQSWRHLRNQGGFFAILADFNFVVFIEFLCCFYDSACFVSRCWFKMHFMLDSNRPWTLTLFYAISKSISRFISKLNRINFAYNLMLNYVLWYISHYYSMLNFRLKSSAITQHFEHLKRVILTNEQSFARKTSMEKKCRKKWTDLVSLVACAC